MLVVAIFAPGVQITLKRNQSYTT